MSEHIRGLNHFYNQETGETSVTWSYVDAPELEHFILEVWDENKRQWVPYDNHMGVIRKAQALTQPYQHPTKN